MKHYNIPIFVPHKGCPHDCVFCNQKHITGNTAEITAEDIKTQIEEYLKTLPNSDRIIEAAFFGGSFTGIDFSSQGLFLSTAYEYLKKGLIDGIRVSTRPDYINVPILEQLKKYGTTTIELGVQSMDCEVLKKSNRGHTKEDVYKAVELIKKYDFSLGLQMMTGLPGDSREKSIFTAKEIIALKPNFVRIYPTLIIKDTALEQMFYRHEYQPQSLEYAVSLCKELMLLFEEAKIPVIRVALQTTDEVSPGGSLVAGPFDSRFRERVETEMYFDKILAAVKKCKSKNIIVTVNDREISKAIGQNKSNINKFKEIHGITVKIKGSKNIGKGEFICTDIEESEEKNCI